MNSPSMFLYPFLNAKGAPMALADGGVLHTAPVPYMAGEAVQLSLRFHGNYPQDLVRIKLVLPGVPALFFLVEPPRSGRAWEVAFDPPWRIEKGTIVDLDVPSLDTCYVEASLSVIPIVEG